MALINCIKRTQNAEGIFEYNEGVEEAEFPEDLWVHHPDISAVQGIEQTYWKWDAASQTVIEASEAEQELINAMDGNSAPNLNLVSNLFSRAFSGSRVYLIHSNTLARTWNTAYGATYFHWSSAITLSNISYRAKGIERKGKFKTKSLHMDGYFSSSANCKIKIHIMKLNKRADSTATTNSVVWTSDEIFSTDTWNRQYDFELPEIIFEDGEELAIAWQRVDGASGTIYFYFDELRFDLERIT